MNAALVAGLLVMVVSSASQAADTLLLIARVDGTLQAVADEDFAQIGELTFRTPLVGYPGEEEAQAIEHEATGPRFRDVLTHFNIGGTIAEAVALDGYRIDIPVDDAIKYDVILATTIDGRRLSIRDHGPLWVIYPLKDHPELKAPVYEARSVWQLKELRMKQP